MKGIFCIKTENNTTYRSKLEFFEAVNRELDFHNVLIIYDLETEERYYAAVEKSHYDGSLFRVIADSRYNIIQEW